jgi:adenosylhomocysteine nucleosidase
LVTIGLIAAMTEECRPLLRRVQGWEVCRLGLFSGYRFRIDGRDCLLVQSGIGLNHAGDAARALLAATRPQLLVSFGVAGAVKDDLHIGDVVSVRSASLLELGIPGPLARLAILSDSAQGAVAGALTRRGARLVRGTALTTRGSQIVHLESPEMENPVLEMETAAIAQAAAEYGVPLMALRGVSDNPREPLPIDPDVLIDENNHLRVGKLIRVLARHPEILFQVRRLRRNTAMAAENVAIAVIVALTNGAVILAG